MDNSQQKNSPKFEPLLELSDKVFVAKVKVEDLVEQNLNARTMPRDMFRQLTANIGIRGNLVESLPFCAETKNGVEIVSGHHRVRAARAGGITEIFVLLDTTGLTPSQIKSKQLSHNAIAGADNPQILKELFEQIEDAESRIAAFIDPKALNIPVPPSIEIGDLITEVTFRQVNFVFLDHQMDKFNDVVALISADTKMVGVADLEQFEKFKKTVQKVKEIDDIRAVGMILSKLCDIALEHYAPQEEALAREKEDDVLEELKGGK